MQFAQKGRSINEWHDSRVLKGVSVKKLAIENNLSTATIYAYINSRRDIRVLNGEIFEIKQLRGKK